MFLVNTCFWLKTFFLWIHFFNGEHFFFVKTCFLVKPFVWWQSVSCENYFFGASMFFGENVYFFYNIFFWKHVFGRTCFFKMKTLLSRRFRICRRVLRIVETDKWLNLCTKISNQCLGRLGLGPAIICVFTIIYFSAD